MRFPETQVCGNLRHRVRTTLGLPQSPLKNSVVRKVKKFSAALRSFALALITCAVATAHQVDSVELEFLTPEGKWQFEGLLDISYMMPDTRGVAGALPKLRTDVMNAPKQEHDRIVAAAEKTMRSLLTLKFNGEELSWKIRFPDFETGHSSSPPRPGTGR